MIDAYVEHAPSKLANVTCFGISFLAILVCMWSVILHTGFETGDYAANSILIQDAKHFQLLHGNYSRIGFNHPGPAILYVLAFGEAISYDLLHVVPSPFSGQLTAGVFYVACWIAIIYSLLSGVSNWSRAAVICAFVSIALVFEHSLIGTLWFPFLYFWPFAAFVLGIGTIVAGRNDALGRTAVSLGFLLNGHIAFVPICGLMLILALAANYTFSRFIPGSQPWTLHRINESAWPLLKSAAIVIAFLAPTIVETIIYYPGPVAKYWEYGGGNSAAHSLLATVDFVSYYWGGWPFPVILAFFLGLLLWQAGTAPTRSSLVAMAISTVGLIFYAKFGIDDFSFKYVGIFYYAVPAILASLAIGHLLRNLVPVRSLVTSAMIIAVAVTLAVYESQKSIRASDYGDPQIPTLFESISKLAGSPVALDLDASGDWGYLWSRLAAAEVYGLRRGEPLFCVNRNWHILFTEGLKCSASQLASRPLFIVSTLDKRGVQPPNGMVADGLVFVPVGLPLIHPGEVISAANDSVRFSRFLQEGWCQPETTHVWSCEKVADIKVEISDPPVAQLILDIEAFLPRSDMLQTASVSINGSPALDLEFTATSNRGERTINLPAQIKGSVDLRLSIMQTRKPSDFGSADTRVLGVALYGMRGR